MVSEKINWILAGIVLLLVVAAFAAEEDDLQTQDQSAGVTQGGSDDTETGSEDDRIQVNAEEKIKECIRDGKITGYPIEEGEYDACIGMADGQLDSIPQESLSESTMHLLRIADIVKVVADKKSRLAAIRLLERFRESFIERFAEIDRDEKKVQIERYQKTKGDIRTREDIAETIEDSEGKPIAELMDLIWAGY